MAEREGTELITLYSDVKTTNVRWLWYPFIAIGKITLLQGDPGYVMKYSGSKSGNFANAFIECFLMNGFGKNHTDELSASSEK